MQHEFFKKQVAEQQQQQEQRETAPEFGSVEEMLRYDAAQTLPPPSVAQRLQESLAREKPRSWWQRWFSRDKEL
jgi:hypothetical protein